MNNMKNIKNIVNKFLDKNKYSEKLMKVIFQMIEIDEDKRLDFEQLEKELKTKV